MTTHLLIVKPLFPPPGDENRLDLTFLAHGGQLRFDEF